MQQLTGNTVPNLPPPLQSGVPLPGVVNGNGVPQVRGGSPHDLSSNTLICREARCREARCRVATYQHINLRLHLSPSPDPQLQLVQGSR